MKETNKQTNRRDVAADNHVLTLAFQGSIPWYPKGLRKNL